MALEYDVLLTGFEPFGGHATNISQTVVSMMAGERALACPWSKEPLHLTIATDVLSVDSRGAQKTSQRIDGGERWDAILHVGLCDSCTVPRIECLARDTLDMRIPDNAGRQVNNTAIDGQGARGCWVDPSVWSPEHFPSDYTLSVDAGAYLCNETYHATLKALSSGPGATPLPPPVLFLHLPSEDHLPVPIAEAFVEACLAHLLRPYPHDAVHVVAAAVRKQDRVLITRRQAGEADGGRWEFPGGKVEPGEHWRDAVVREVREELDLEVSPSHPLGTWFRSRGDAHYAIHLVLCTSVDDDAEPAMSVHDAFDWRGDFIDDALVWAGRDGEMAERLQNVIKSMSSPHRRPPSNARR